MDIPSSIDADQATAMLDQHTANLESGLDKLQTKVETDPTARALGVTPPLELPSTPTFENVTPVGQLETPEAKATGQAGVAWNVAQPPPEQPALPWRGTKDQPGIADSDAFKALSPVDQLQAANNYAGQAAAYARFRGADSNAIAAHTQSFLDEEHDRAFPKPDDAWDFGAGSGILSAGATVAQTILGAGKGLVRYLTPELPKTATDFSGKQVPVEQAVGYDAMKSVQDGMHSFGDFLQTWREEIPAGLGIEHDTSVAGGIGKVVGGAVPYIALLPAAIAMSMGETYGDALDKTGSKTQAKIAAAGTGLSNMLFMGLASYTAGVGKNIPNVVARWATKMAAGTAGNISVQQLTKAGEAALEAPENKRATAFKTALMDFNLKDVGVQAAFAALATYHGEAKLNGVSRSLSEPVVKQFNDDTAKAADYRAKGFPQSAQATENGANADFNARMANVHTIHEELNKFRQGGVQAVSPEARAVIFGVDPEAAGTTVEQAQAYADKIGVKWQPPEKAAEPTTAKPAAKPAAEPAAAPATEPAAKQIGRAHV